MKTKFLLLLTVITTLGLTVAGCATSKQEQTTKLLRRAGFRAMLATTFEKQQRLKSLPADQLTKVKSANGTVYYVYPLNSENLLYAGRAADYARYQNLLTPQTGHPGADESWARQADSDESWKDVWSAPSDF